MLVTLQFPIADARPFRPTLDLRRPLPDWPNPTTTFYPQFLHFFGQTTERHQEPDQAWPDEIAFCRAKRGLRFERLEAHHVGLQGQRFQARSAFRRLFCDGQAVVRMEMGFFTVRPDNATPLTLGEVLSVARGIAQCPTRVPTPNGPPNLRPLITQGKSLARIFAHASMNPVQPADYNTGMDLVEAAPPMILVQLGLEEAIADTPPPGRNGIQKVNPGSVNGAEAMFCFLETKPGIVPTWLLRYGTASKEQLRGLRICLTRLHAEREVLDLVLKQIHRKRLLNPPTQESVDCLDKYFNDRLKLINRGNWGGLNQSQVLAAFDATLAVVRPASQAQLISRYEGSRRQVWQKINEFQEQRRATRIVETINVEKGGTYVRNQANVNGDGNIINMAEYMSNVTNTINNNIAKSNADNQVIDLIKELTDQVESVASQADPVQVKKMGKNLERLSEEVASEEPEQSWYEVSLKGLKEAAEAVGEIAAPILGTVAKLAAFLL